MRHQSFQEHAQAVTSLCDEVKSLESSEVMVGRYSCKLSVSPEKRHALVRSVLVGSNAMRQGW